jgi:hypothetical protein
MAWPTAGGFALILTMVAGAALEPPAPGAPAPSAAAVKTEPVTLSGTVLLLAEALKPTGLTFDTEPLARQVVLKGDDGVITPLISDEASRALFQDERLRNRRTEIKGLRHPGLSYLQVVSYRIVAEGRLRTPEYYCEVCTISVRFPQICPCCQGAMVLRMRPDPH